MVNILTKENLEKVKVIAIFGDIGTGKTALAYKIISLFDKDVYFLKHPKPDFIEGLGYKNLDTLERMEKLSNCVLYIDEPQLFISLYNKKANRIIAKICSLARQLNITLIISSSDTRVFTRHNEAYFDLWLIKDLDYKMVKNGSTIKYAIKKKCIFDPSGFKLEDNEFLSESRKLNKFNGIHTFELIEGWSDTHSKPFLNSE